MERCPGKIPGSVAEHVSAMDGAVLSPEQERWARAHDALEKKSSRGSWVEKIRLEVTLTRDEFESIIGGLDDHISEEREYGHTVMVAFLEGIKAKLRGGIS